MSLAVYRAAQSVAFDASVDQYGRGTACTAACVVRLRNGSLAGIAAGHCSRYPFFDASGVWQTETALRLRSTPPGRQVAKEPLGSVFATGSAAAARSASPGA